MWTMLMTNFLLLYFLLLFCLFVGLNHKHQWVRGGVWWKQVVGNMLKRVVTNFPLFALRLFLLLFYFSFYIFFVCLLSMSMMIEASQRHVGNGNDQFSIVRTAPILKVIVGLRRLQSLIQRSYKLFQIRAKRGDKWKIVDSRGKLSILGTDST